MKFLVSKKIFFIKINFPKLFLNHQQIMNVKYSKLLRHVSLLPYRLGWFVGIRESPEFVFETDTEPKDFNFTKILPNSVFAFFSSPAKLCRKIMF